MKRLTRVLLSVAVLLAAIAAFPEGSVALWEEDGTALCTATGGQRLPAIVSDDAGGAIVAWEDYRTSYECDIYVQRVNASGGIEWTVDGVALCTATGSQRLPAITSDGAGGAIVTWHDTRSGSSHIYAQRVNALGVVEWVADGVALCTATANQFFPTITSDGAGGAIVTWQDSRSGRYDIYAQKVNALGIVEWTVDGVALCTATGDQWYPAITSDGVGGAITAWADYRTAAGDIYTQRVNATGQVVWATDGVGVCTVVYNQDDPYLTSDGVGGAIIAWADYRTDAGDIYAQRVDATGTLVWGRGGIAVCTAANRQRTPVLILSDADGVIIAWLDERSGAPGMYAQGIDAEGYVRWTPNGIPICSATVYDKFAPALVSDETGGAFFTWGDNRSVTLDIYAQRVDGAGTALWAVDGVPVSTAVEHQREPCIVFDGGYGAVIAWQDYRGGDWDVYAQRADLSGHMGDPGYTEEGSNVVVTPVDSTTGTTPITVTFDSVIVAGVTTLVTSETGAPPPLGFKLGNPPTYYELTTTAVFTDSITICFDYTGIDFGVESALTLSHREDSHWVDCTVSLDTLSNIICGRVSSLSLFGIFEKLVPATVDFDPDVLNVRSDGEWVTCHIELPEEYDVAEIDVGSVVLNGEVSAEAFPFCVGDYDLDGVADLMVKFSRFEVGTILPMGPDVLVTVTGDVGLDEFSGTDTISVINPPIILPEDGGIAPSVENVSLHSYPNPFNPSVQIVYAVPSFARVLLQVWDIDGRLVRVLEDGERSMGTYVVNWDGRDETGREVSSGLYVCRLVVGDEVVAKKMALLK